MYPPPDAVGKGSISSNIGRISLTFYYYIISLMLARLFPVVNGPVAETAAGTRFRLTESPETEVFRGFLKNEMKESVNLGNESLQVPRSLLGRGGGLFHNVYFGRDHGYFGL